MIERDTQPIDLIVRGELVGFGALRREDVVHTRRWFNDLRVMRTLSWDFRPLTADGAERFWERGFALTGDDVTFTVYELATMRAIGGVSLNRRDDRHGTAELALLIGEPATWGQGYGTEVTRLILAYAFDVLGLYNVSLVVYDNNPWALRAYERAGFKRIGVRRGAHRVGRRRFDVVLMDAVADDFAPSALDAIMHPRDAAPGDEAAEVHVDPLPRKDESDA